MALKVGINGFGRIGRLVFRAGAKNPNIEFVGINDLVPPDNLAYLLKHDSTHGKFEGTVEAAEDGIVVNGKKIPCFSIRNPAELPWGKQGAEHVVESTGLFTDYAGAENHLKAGAKRVILSAPTKDPSSSASAPGRSRGWSVIRFWAPTSHTWHWRARSPGSWHRSCGGPGTGW